MLSRLEGRGNQYRKNHRGVITHGMLPVQVLGVTNLFPVPTVHSIDNSLCRLVYDRLMSR